MIKARSPRTTLATIFATCVLSLNLPAQARDEGALPNLVLIIADDLGYGDLGCYGGKIPTPHLDRMANEGLRLTDFHSNGSVCSPSRAALISGKYQQRTGVDGVVTADPENAAYRFGLDPEKQTTLPKAMSQAGYKTALFGKWHLGYLDKFHPMNYGFDRFVGFVSGNIDYHSHLDRMNTFDWWHNRELTKETGYSTHLITRHAVDYIEKHKDEPFFVYVAHEAVHSPIQGPTDAIQRGPDKVKGERRPSKEVYRDMLTELDKGVGEILKALQDNGLAEKTLVVFSSDNGPMKLASPGPLKGRKGSIYEGGHRVPGVFWWPGTIEPGTESKQTAAQFDLFPTIVDLAGIKGDFDFDGVSIKSLWNGEKLANRKLFWRPGGLSPYEPKLENGKDVRKAIRDGKWKLVAQPGYEKVELFDLESDLAEKHDLASKHPERVERMKQELHAWEQEMLTLLPYQTKPSKKK
ncbi:sulfatase-like hydrolase/transferase [Haloferula sp.]|uniref:sulfatase-like hydrolase/transferase n=1 Tax=Haloferula sp. TaxID=2497595 RepID=UPI00329B41DC